MHFFITRKNNNVRCLCIKSVNKSIKITSIIQIFCVFYFQSFSVDIPMSNTAWRLNKLIVNVISCIIMQTSPLKINGYKNLGHMFSSYGLCAGRGLYRATPVGTRGLGLWGFIPGTLPIKSLSTTRNTFFIRISTRSRRNGCRHFYDIVNFEMTEWV